MTPGVLPGEGALRVLEVHLQAGDPGVREREETPPDVLAELQDFLAQEVPAEEGVAQGFVVVVAQQQLVAAPGPGEQGRGPDRGAAGGRDVQEGIGGNGHLPGAQVHVPEELALRAPVAEQQVVLVEVVELLVQKAADHRSFQEVALGQPDRDGQVRVLPEQLACVEAGEIRRKDRAAAGGEQPAQGARKGGGPGAAQEELHPGVVDVPCEQRPGSLRFRQNDLPGECNLLPGRAIVGEQKLSHEHEHAQGSLHR